MNKIIERLRSKAGESLIESMAAILIFTFASISMYTMIMSSNDINLRAKESEETNMEQIVIAEMAASEGKMADGTVSFSIKAGTDTMMFDPVPVEIYGESDGMYAYYPKGE